MISWLFFFAEFREISIFAEEMRIGAYPCVIQNDNNDN
jgi:hypothetical protein